MAIPHKSKARERFEDADAKKPDAPQIEPDPESRPKPEFVIVDHEISPSQTRWKGARMRMIKAAFAVSRCRASRTHRYVR